MRHSRSTLLNATVTKVDSIESGRLAEAALRGGLKGDEWQAAIIQCADTLVWAMREPNGGWALATAADPNIRPPRLSMLREARVFGTESELLIWRQGADLTGRRIADADGDSDAAPIDRVCPWDQGDDRAWSICPTAYPGFVGRRSVSGRITVTPGTVARETDYLGVRTRHYLTEDPETGLLRIAATRYVRCERVP